MRNALFASSIASIGIYAVLKEFSSNYHGKLSVLEFGTSDGYAFVKLLYATRYLRLENRVVVHGFDSFEGMPAPADERDEDWVSRDNWCLGSSKRRLRRARRLLLEAVIQTTGFTRGILKASIASAAFPASR